MVKTLTMKCPHCNQVSEVFLSTNACVVILNCPSCFSPIMYFEQKSFLLTPKQVSALKDKTHNENVMKTLEKIAHPEPAVVETAKQAARIYKNSTCADTGFNPIVSTGQDGEKYICSDDITNLRIELALCRDVQQFIEQI